MTGLHINSTDRTAKTLAIADLWDDPYHNNIQHAARRLLEHSPHINWLYGGQYMSGTTWWYVVDSLLYASVYTNGTVIILRLNDENAT